MYYIFFIIIQKQMRFEAQRNPTFPVHKIGLETIRNRYMFYVRRIEFRV